MKTNAGKSLWLLSLVITGISAIVGSFAVLERPVPQIGPGLTFTILITVIGCLVYSVYGWIWFVKQPSRVFFNYMADVGEKVVAATPWVILASSEAALTVFAVSYALERSLLLFYLTWIVMSIIGTGGAVYLVRRKVERDKDK